MKDDQSQRFIHTAFFRFFEELNDFLPEKWHKTTFPYKFSGTPSIKHTVEVIGVPHTEIDLILVDGESVDFNYNMRGHEHVSVYPVFESFDITPIHRLRPKPMREIKFIVDVNAGKLAQKLRLLGLDASFRNDFTDKEIVGLSSKENRTILTRDKGILKCSAVTRGYWIRNEDPDEQVREVVDRFQLENNLKLFTRCSICNNLLHPVDKSLLHDRLPSSTLLTFNIFLECQGCKKIYWQGSHYERIREWMNRIIKPG